MNHVCNETASNEIVARIHSITPYDDRMFEEVSSIRAQSSHLTDQGENDLRLSDDAVIGLAGSRKKECISGGELFNN